MRADAIGFFWQDVPRKGKDRIARVMPPIPDTGWELPTEFPNLSAAKALSVDVESYDPELRIHGPGWARGKGHLVGIAVGTDDGYRRYFPMRHEVEKDWNIPPEHVLAWAKDTLCDPSQPKVGANLTYDVGWLWHEGVPISGPLYDVEFAEALLKEDETVNLDDLANRWLGEHKVGNVLYEWCAAYYGGKENDSQRANIYRAPPRLVGPYAEGDVDLPFRVLDRQWPELASQGLLDLFSMENRLIYLMVTMRFAGVSIDVSRAEQLRDQMLEDLKEVDKQIEHIVGFGVNTNAGESIAQAFDTVGLPYGRTKPSKNFPEGKPSFTKEFLATIDHPLVDLIKQKKEREKLISTFLEGYLLNAHVNGKVYGSFNQLRGDDTGARSGRFSSTNPNLQNIPARTKLGKLIRTCFIPDYGHQRWDKYDYSQIEYRGLAHYAVGPGSEDVRARYNADPLTDFHTMVQNIIKEVVGIELERPYVKNTNFGTVYGMGEKKLAHSLKLSKKQAHELMEAIHKGAPFMKATMNATMAEAEYYGFITTIMGRRSRFDLWVPEQYDEKSTPLPWEKAILQYRNPKRAYLHKALNRRLQGSAADLIKLAMLICWEGGVFAETGVPRLTVHDELDFSNPGGKDPAFREMQHIMETAIPFRVPIKVGHDVGPNWGECAEVEE